jgi:hypothetical protein
MTKRFLVSFEITTDSCGLADLTAHLGVSPGATSHEISVDARTGLPTPTIWKLESEAAADASLEEHLDSVFVKLDGVDPLGLARLPRDADMYVNIGVLVPGPMGSAGIPARFLQRMGSLSLGLEVVCYFCENEEGEEM